MGNTFMEVKNITSSPAFRVTCEDFGDLIQRCGPFYKGARLKLVVKNKQVYNIYYILNDLRSRIGEESLLTFNSAFLTGKIVKILLQINKSIIS